MPKTLQRIIQLKAILWVNAFCYYFQRLWLVGKWLPDTIYARYGLKQKLAVVAVIVRQLLDFAGKPLYLLCFVGLPLLLASDQPPAHLEQGFACLVQVLFFFNCLVGSFGDSQIFAVTRDKITCIKYLHMNARTYTHSSLAFKYVPFFAYYLFWLLLLTPQLGGTLPQGFLVWLMLLSFRLIGEACQLWFFDRTGKVLCRNLIYTWVLIGVAAVGAYLPFFLGGGWWLAAVLLHPVAIAFYVILGAVSFWYITAGYRGYEAKLPRSLDLNFLLSSLLKSASGTSSGFKEVEIKEKDTAISHAKQEKVQQLQGYSYLNALFFARHRRQLLKPVYYRLLMVALLLAGGIALWFADRELAVTLSSNLTLLLPSFLFIMYFMTVADKASRAMFYNCDKDLLHYAYYRQPAAILKNFQIRLLRVSLYDIAIAAALCLVTIIFCLLCGVSLFTLELLLFCTAILLLAVLFTVHHLCLYYIFQPYSENLRVKNPFFSALNAGMYLLCFFCLRLEVGGLSFTLGVLAFTLLYITVALVLVYRRAPASFRVK